MTRQNSTLRSLVLPDRYEFHYRDQLVPSDSLAEVVRSASKLIETHPTQSIGRKGILLDNTPLFVAAFMSIISSESNTVLMNPAMRPYEIVRTIKETGIRILISSGEFDNVVAELPFRSRVIGTVNFAPWGELKFYEILQEVSTLANAPQASLGEFVCQLTSGVSGESRIVPRTYANVVDEIENFASTIKLTSDDIILCPAPLFHAYGLFNGLVPSLCTGAKFVLMRRFFPAEIIELIEQYRPTILIGVPFMYELLMKTFLPQPVDFGCYRLCLSAGAKLPVAVADDFFTKFGVRINQLYGSTETGVMSVNLNGDADSVGRPVNGRRIRVVDEEGNEARRGAEGEIAIASAGTTSGYLGWEEFNRKAFRSGWFYTGDIGRFDEPGDLFITGRKSSFINIGGLKVDPTEVENVIQASGQVEECAVVGIPRVGLGEIVCAYVVLRPNADRESVASFCRERLSSFKVPREFHDVDSLPRSPTGKMLKKYLVNGLLERSSVP